MKGSIITSSKIKTRHPALAGFLSMLFTGLGQVYNGEGLKGAAFLVMLTIAILCIPLAAIAYGQERIILMIPLMLIFSIFVVILSAVEAVCKAVSVRETKMKYYNTWYCYTAYAASAACSLLVLINAATSFFSMEQINGELSSPSLRTGEILLIYSPLRGAPQKGDLVAYNKNYARVVASTGDAVKIIKNRIAVNGKTLPLEKTGTADLDTPAGITGLFRETNGGRTYPVLIPSRIPDKTFTRLKENELCIMNDDRTGDAFMKIIRVSEIEGIVSGIIFSHTLSRVCTMP